ncbi:MAG TPA: asparagine synthase (glutamine-hydrolyzing), partial [Thermoanaerobaculia bacterium]
MCGIAGALSRRGDDELLKRRVFTMTEALRHRGPDSAGFVDAPGVSLSVRRLAIIDVEHGDQPLYSEDRQIAAIANCEIYNHVELREQLIRRGHTFATHSDAEVIVHLYEEHGAAFVEQLRGMFAIALWDARRKRLLLARDRMGEKPLYLFETSDALYFASEMKALLASGVTSRELDPVAVHQFLHFSFIPEPRTAIRGIRKLPAATWMTFDLDDWKVEERRYWNMEDAPPIAGDPATAIRDRLDDIAEIVVRSDVPVGIALSGGLDSTAIAALVAKKGIARCISVGYPGRPENDESGFAEETARALDLPFMRVELAASEVAATFEDLIARQDDPIADIAAAGYAAVAWAAHETGTKVLLQGQGGDELFWGYPWVVEAVKKTRRKNHLVFYELTPQDQAAERLFRDDA